MSDPNTEAPESPVDVESLRLQLAAAEQKAAEHWDRALRTAAELENLRRRSEREAQATRKYALEQVLGDLIAVNDSLELGLKAAAGDSPEVKAVREGMQLTHRQLWTTLNRYGVTEVDPADQPFNPDEHEAVSMAESPDAKPNHVITVMQKGYKLHDRLLRPAMVVVAKAGASP
ncbi:MAG TPA: nucleotide exchange factor GrpE [Candidatus Binatia bacterium]|nr:nucleotide exchange factor GrpE [Candidatus Binatia bacterium]